MEIKNFNLRHKLISGMQDINIRGSRRIAYIFAKLLIPKPKGNLRLKTNYGFELLIDPVKDKGVERSLYYTGTYEKGSLSIISQILRKGDVFVDIGANIGLMSIFVSSIVGKEGKVIAFEPNLETRNILTKNISLNNIENIEISSYAIGAKREKSKIYDRWDSSRGSATLIKPDDNASGYDIEVISLPEYISHDTSVNLIKIDIEGYELEALRGATEILSKDLSPMLIVECSDTREYKSGDSIGTLYDLVKKHNYKIYKSSRGKGRLSKLVEVNHKNEMPHHDNIFCFTKHHLLQIPTTIFK